jgi:hypothetical protein
MKNYLVVVLFLLLSIPNLAQDNTQIKSNIQAYTPSKLVGIGQYDVKWFNNLYTQTKSTFSDNRIARESFYTATVEAYTGVSEEKRLNVGLILEYRSNTNNNRPTFDVFKFDGDVNSARNGFTSLGLSVKYVPFKSNANFSVQSSIFVPLIDNEVENGVFLDQKGYTWQNRFFYDVTFPGDRWQLFSEINSEFNFGKQEASFANNSLRLSPGVFLSYFPSSKLTLLVLVQHSQLFSISNGFSQDYTALGGGTKYQLTKALNLEALYSNFVRGNDTGLGQSFNLGLRAIL